MYEIFRQYWFGWIKVLFVYGLRNKQTVLKDILNTVYQLRLKKWHDENNFSKCLRIEDLLSRFRFFYYQY